SANSARSRSSGGATSAMRIVLFSASSRVSGSSSPSRAHIRVNWPFCTSEKAPPIPQRQHRFKHHCWLSSRRLGEGTALWLGRKDGRLTLSQLGELAGGVNYAAVAQALSRFEKRLAHQPGLRKLTTRLENYLSNIMV